jgi:acetyl-CoA synthetase
MTRENDAIESVLQETRLFQPPPPQQAGAERWLIDSLEMYRHMYARSMDDPEAFWAEAARQLHWFRDFDRALEWSPPDAKWFAGGTTNACYNCIDRHVEAGHGEKVALIWEGEPVEDGAPEIRQITYGELQQLVSRFANVLKAQGVGKGDVVTIYMGMVPELAVAVLACARIGAPHSVIFGGFSAQAIVDRVHDADSKVIVTCDGAWRRGQIVPLKDNVDEACSKLEGEGAAVQKVIVLKRCGNDIGWREGRDLWFHEAVEAASAECPCAEMDAEDMLFLLYTSGSTGKPKGIVHTTGGYMVYTWLTSKYVFNLIPDTGQVFWCTADVGWVTGHSYIIYGILSNRVPSVMYEGAPNFPHPGRFWEIVDRHTVTQFYTAPTAIRAFMKWGAEHPRKHDLSSLQVLGTVGEPINPEAWMWYHREIGRERCPIVDTWWQTETGGHMITPLPGAIATKPGSCTLPFFGIDAAILNDRGEEQPANSGGLLGIRRPWPGMLRGIHKDRQRFIDTYFSKFRCPARPPRAAPRRTTSPVMGRGGMRTGTSGSWGGWTM